MCKEREYVYYLPTEDGEKEECITNEDGKRKERRTKENSVIIIGANGSGKSRLGAWMEQQDINNHRIGGQRSLLYNKDLALKSYQAARSLLKFGQIIDDNNNVSKTGRWGWTNDDYITKELNDFDFALAALFSLHNEETNEYYAKAKSKGSLGEKIDMPGETVIDKLISIWNIIFPHRELKYHDYNFVVQYNGEEYSAYQMSDGERAVLYLASQVLSISEGKVNRIIIDEPEIHLHPSIMHNLWVELEKARKDILFIYITHDINFASIHRNSDKIWVNKYFGNEKWDYQVLSKNDELPEQLLLEILGCRQNILFVESNRDHDYRLYTVLFSNMYVIPSGGCEQVIRWTKAVNQLNDNYKLYKYKAYGLIDRDYKSDEEIAKYEDDKVYCLKVAEIENLFITEKVLKHIANIMGKVDKWDNIFSEIKNFIIEKKYKNNVKRQEFNNIKYDINRRMKSIGIDGKAEADIKEAIEHVLDNINYQQIKTNIVEKFEGNTNKKYDEILGIYNEKELSKSIGNYLGLDNKKYCDTIIDMLSSDKELKAIFYEYLPEEIIKANNDFNTNIK